MTVTVLHVPDCPGAAVLRDRLVLVLGDALSAQVTWQVITDEDQARRYGMTGSPTLLIDGTDPFDQSGQQPSLSCRLYRDDDGTLGPAPSTAQLRTGVS
jgi:hypothetical protein